MKPGSTLYALVVLLSLCTAVPCGAWGFFKPVYVRQACTLLKDPDGVEIAGLVCKGDSMRALRPSLSFISEIGNYEFYKVRTQDGTVGYIPSKYVTYDRGEARKRYKADFYDPLHSAAKNKFGGGDPLGCDFFPVEKPVEIAGKRMPKSCYSLYLTCSRAVLQNIDAYIAIAKDSRINTFVIDIKEDGLAGFKADAMKKYSPSACAKAPADGLELYRNAVEKIHAGGYWAVGRIVTFKDYFLTKDNPRCALWDKVNNCMLLHNKSHWPSAYCRLVWEYNVSLAIEAVQKIGFDEINFDYVRFPDRMMKIEAGIEMRNSYAESKVQAIQRFVTYAVERIHRAGAFVSIDVFGESANPGYTTAYGQYWPAISNVADVMCGMPYPDHFRDGYYGVHKPWNHPYEIMRAWGERVCARQKETPSPAIVRTWVQAYHVMRHVDRNGIDYNAENITKEIRGLFDAGLTGGYTTWLSSANIDRYRSQSPAFKIDYFQEWLEKQ